MIYSPDGINLYIDGVLVSGTISDNVQQIY